MDPKARDLIEGVLQMDPMNRFGMPGTKNDMNSVFLHPFFRSFNFNSDVTKQANII